MVTSRCKKCGETFKTKSEYDIHLKNEIPCETINIIKPNEKVNNKKNEKVIKIIKKKLQKKIIFTSESEFESEFESESDTTTDSEIDELSDINIDDSISNAINNKNKKVNKLKMIDLCAGTGAFTYAFEKTNLVDVVFANDFEETSKTIYDYNFKHKLTLGNICEIDIKDIPSHDILTAGFPCQPFSIAGKQKGFRDTRSNVFWKIIEIIKHHKPQCVILENVKNLTSHDDGNTFKIIKESLEKEKYNIIYKVLNTSDITTVPQHRERIHIVCVNNKKIFDEFNLDFKKVKKQSIRTMLINHNNDNDIDEKYYYDNEDNHIHKMIIDSVIDVNSVYQFRRKYVRENKNNECPTLTANMGTGGHNVPIILDDNGPRKLIPRECFNFQGFPMSYKLPKMSDSKLYKLAGNAVSVPVVSLIANRIVPVIIKI
jgi:DNA (cytosine-5)-methyltransferase 1